MSPRIDIYQDHGKGQFMNKNNNRSEQQQIDVFEDISAEATKDNIVTNEREEREKEERRLDEDMRLGNDPIDW
jgi:hypothetical protein